MERKNNFEMAISLIKLNFPYVEMIVSKERDTIIFCGEANADIIEKEYDRLYFLESFLNYLGYNMRMSDDPSYLKGFLTP